MNCFCLYDDFVNPPFEFTLNFHTGSKYAAVYVSFLLNRFSKN